MLGRIHSNFHFCVDDANVYCENGQALSIYGDFCHECQECPIATYSVSIQVIQTSISFA